MAKLGRLKVEGLDLRSLSAFRILVGLNVIYNLFTHTRFVFAWYVRRYRTQIPQSIIDRWVAYEMEQYNKAYPDQQVVEAKMFFFSNKTSLTNGQVSRERSFFPVQ